MPDARLERTRRAYTEAPLWLRPSENAAARTLRQYLASEREDARLAEQLAYLLATAIKVPRA